MRARFYISCLLAILLTASVQPVRADENTARLYIPSLDMTVTSGNTDTRTFSVITPRQPYFTLYIWYLNNNGRNSYWGSDPTLTIDDNDVVLTGLHDDSEKPKCSWDQLTCSKNGTIYYWVRRKTWFKVANATFTQVTPMSDCKEDYYLVVDIMFPENKVGGTHTVSVHGNFCANWDSQGSDYHARDFDGNEILTTLPTGGPFSNTMDAHGEIAQENKMVQWTNPGELTFTSHKMSKVDDWGMYQASIDGATSTLAKEGKLITKKDYGKNADYQNIKDLPMDYYYHTAMEWSDTLRSNGNSNAARFGFEHMGYNGSREYFHLCDRTNNRTIYGDVFNGQIYLQNFYIGIDGADIEQDGTIKSSTGKITAERRDFNKNLTRIAAIDTDGNVMAEWKGCAKTASITFPKDKALKYIDLECDGLLYGYNVDFVKSGKMTPDKLAYPSTLTATPNPWNREVLLTWKLENRTSSPQNDTGKFHIYRNDKWIGNVDGGNTLSFSFYDKNIDYDTFYTYKVNYVPEAWTDTMPAPGLTVTTDTKMQHTVNISDFSAKAIADGYDLQWKLDSKLNDTKYTFDLYRIELTENSPMPTPADFLKQKPIDAIPVTTIQPAWYYRTDKDVNSTSNYAYMVALNAQDALITQICTPEGHPDKSHVNNIWATCGDHTNYVHLQWESNVTSGDEVTYTIYRHAIQEGENNINSQEDAQNANLQWDEIYSVKSSQTSLSYDDKSVVPGVYYAYAVKSCTNGSEKTVSFKACDGFARGTGTVYGTTTYEGGKYAVEGVRVDLLPTGDTGKAQFNSLSLSGSKSGVSWTLSKQQMQNYFRNRPFSVQMYVNPDTLQDGTCLFDINGVLNLSLSGNGITDGGYALKATAGSSTYTSQLRLKPGCFTSLAFTYDGRAGGWIHIMAPDSLGCIASEQLVKDCALTWAEGEGRMTIATDCDTVKSLKGYVDDVRVFNRQLSADDVTKNYNHYMGGTENGLVAYWSFDETVSTMRHAYDYSSANSTSNGNHATIMAAQRNSINCPEPEQLSLFAVTDADGHYSIQNIPFADNGTSYDITPSKGTHKFTPTSRTITVSKDQVNFESKDFTDESKFKVRGFVYYENTTYPVKGCTFLLDNIEVRTEYNELVTTDENGEYAFDAGIGEHIISVVKDGHTFLNDGHYPATGKVNINKDISHLTFFDTTKAIIAGRVVGGAVEKNKPLGLGLSRGNIGAATLRLLTGSSEEDAHNMNTHLDSLSGEFVAGADTLFYTLADSSRVKSIAYTANKKDGKGDIKSIIIKTDPRNGEFAVMLPPVPYYIETVVDNNTEATAALKEKTMLDCTDVQKWQTAVDTVMVDSVTIDTVATFRYNVGFVKTYFSQPVISVSQYGSPEGAFGEKTVPAGELGATTDTYTEANGQITYKYGVPIFNQGASYHLDITSYEQYFNYDEDPAHPYETRVPSTEGYITISNPMTQDADTVAMARLDSLGHYDYTFQPIKANNVAPYTQPLSIILALGENRYAWNWTYRGQNEPLQCIVLGTKLTGNTSVTSAPDALINIIRDPYGSNSNTVWNKGSQLSWGFDIKVGGHVNIGSVLESSTGVGVKAATGVGLYVFSGVTAKAGSSYDLSWHNSLDINGGAVWSFTNTNEVSTSAEPYYDGANGDVFIGLSSVYNYGEGEKVMLVDDQKDGYQVGTQSVIAVAQEMETQFSYTQDHIINHLIPRFKELREARLVQVSETALQDARKNFRNSSDSIVYMTSLLPSDPRFGTSLNDPVWGDESVSYDELNWGPDSLYYYGPSYTAFLPADGKFRDEEERWDAILNINNNIKQWEYFLALNEEAKVKAINREPKATYSFDSGASRSYTHVETKTGSEGINFETAVNYIQKFGVLGSTLATTAETVAAGGFVLDTELHFNPSFMAQQVMNKSYVVNLSDPVPDNEHTISMYDAPDDFGYIFRQLSGQTSCNYEGEEVTRYYEPNSHVLSESTDQIETPHIDCDQPVQTGVPVGQPAMFKLKLTNPTLASVTRDIEFDLLIVDDKWGLNSIVTTNLEHSDGVTLSPGDSVLVTMMVQPVSNDIIHIDSLHVCFYSVGQPSVSDDIYLAAHFQPQPEDIELTASRDLIYTGTDSTLVLTAKGFKPNSSILNAVKLQQRKQGTSEWTTIHSWVTGTPAGDNESALTGERIDTLIDMHDKNTYPDDTYEFRAVTDCTVAGESVLGQSAILTIVKDVTLPQPIQQPSPADGVLSTGDNISVTFNESIHSQSLNKPDNFSIQAVLNTDSLAHEVALRLDGAATPAAHTQTPLTLSGTPFTICTWVKHSGTGGTLLHHGNLRLNLEADGSLTAYIPDGDNAPQPVTSGKAIPQDTWTYLAVVYDNTDGTLSAYTASGDQESTLMLQQPVGKKAQSQGTIYLGENLQGAMHELTLYNTALTWPTIKSQMYTGKSHSKPSLIGYWRLDEGHGTQSEDRARGRHMLLASASSWHLENENISLRLDTACTVGIPLGELSTNDATSYLVEMWAKADSTQADGASLISLDAGGRLDITLAADGKLALVTGGTAYTASRAAFTPGQWHHVALNVMRGTGSEANLIVDGTSVLNIPADKVPALQGGRLWLGRGMTGTLDEVRLWHGTHTQASIADRMYYRMDASQQSGLVGYYPFEKTYYDEYDQRIYTFALENHGYQAPASTTLVTDTAATAQPTAGTSAPGLKSAPHLTNLDFNFVANDKTVTINLEHTDAALEDCTVSTTLHDYYDLHRNVGSPISWSFVVKQNTLSWNTQELTAHVPVGEGGTFQATLSNNGGDDQIWSFTELPSWLQASPLSGTIVPHESQTVTFTVQPGQAIGKYSTTVSVRGNKQLDTPLDICLCVEGEKPDWVAVQHSENMDFVAQISIDGITSTDPDDILGIFYHDECVGVGQPAYVSSKDAYYIHTLVYGEADQPDDPLTFRIYDASRGYTYPLAKATPDIYFTPDARVGTIDSPVIVESQDKLEQTLSIDKGWAYISLYLDPDKKDMSLFDDIAGDVDAIKNEAGQSAQYKSGAWTADISPVKPGQMLKISMKQAAKLSVIGSSVKPADYPQTVSPGNTWIGVPVSQSMGLVEAFASIDPREGDVVKNESEASMYMAGEWVGTLASIEPGHGYIYNSLAPQPKTLIFPETPTEYAAPSFHSNQRYSNSMIALCSVHDDFGPVSDATIEVFDQQGELRGRTITQLRDSLHLVFISGEQDGEDLILTAHLPGGKALVSMLPQGFRPDTQLGRLNKPYVISELPVNIDSTLSDGTATLTVYTASGILIYHGPANDFQPQHNHSGEILIAVETDTNGSTHVYKMK